MKVAKPKEGGNKQEKTKQSNTNKSKAKNKWKSYKNIPAAKKVRPSSEAIQKMEIPEHLKSYPNILGLRKFNPNFFYLLVTGAIKTKTKKEKEKSSQESKILQCYICKEEGHLAKTCPQRAYKKGKLSQEHLQQIKCYKCHELGHTSKDCKADPADVAEKVLSKKAKLQCHNCKEEGHLAKDCTSQRPARTEHSTRSAPTSRSTNNTIATTDRRYHQNSEKDKVPFSQDVPKCLSHKPFYITPSLGNPSAAAKRQPTIAYNSSTNGNSSTSAALTPVVAMDCEMVGIGDGGKTSFLARVSIVNQRGECLYDKYVKPMEPVTDYRTAVSGIRPTDLVNALDLKTVQNEVAAILDKRILVGHALKNDLDCLFLGHPRKNIRDTAKYKPFRQLYDGKTPSLKKLSRDVLDLTIQTGEHDSVQDAQAAMLLYTRVRKDWERHVSKKKEKPKSLLSQVL